MRRLFLFLVAVAMAGSLVMAGCSSAAAPAPPPTKAPAAPTKAAEPAKAAVAPTSVPPTPVPPTAVPIPKVDFPQKGRAISIVVPWAAGGGNDVAARLLAPGLEKELGTPVQVVNRVGAGGQVGMTEVANAKPDGYTLGYTPLPSTITVYLDPERKATFNRKSFQPVALQADDGGVLAVKPDSTYKTMKDIMDDAKANPEKVKAGDGGILNPGHLAILQLQKMTGVKFAVVLFDSGSLLMTGLLGGHVDFGITGIPDALGVIKGGGVRALAVGADQESKFVPGVTTMQKQGFNLRGGSSARGISAPAGTPKEIVDILSAGVKKAMESEQYKSKMEELGLNSRYMDAAQYEAYWAQTEAEIQPLISLARQ